MARTRGLINTTSNYEVIRPVPFDARVVTQYKSDLISTTAYPWTSVYDGMLVSVYDDPLPENNGVYFLKDANTYDNNDYSAWVKLFTQDEFTEFQASLSEDLQNYVTQEQISAYSKMQIVTELPAQGEANTIYFRELDGNWEEYIWYNNNFVIVGSNAAMLDNYYTKQEVDEKLSTLQSQIPTSLSQLSNLETGFITASVDNLVNYYTKSETYTRDEISDLISDLATTSFQVVQSLPSTGITNIIYLLPKEDSSVQDGYDEYIWVNNGWEKIGSTDIELSGYVTTEYLTEQLQEYVLRDEFEDLESQVAGLDSEVDDLTSRITQVEENIPTKVSQLTNDVGYTTITEVQGLLNNFVTENELETELSSYATLEQLSSKQDTLVSGTNIKTINGQSILGEGNIEIQGGSGGTPPIATTDAVGGILATDSGENEDVSAYVDVESDGKAFVKIPSVDETSTADDVVNLLNTSTLILNGNAE